MGFSRKSYEKLPWWSRKLNWVILALVIVSFLSFLGGKTECNVKTAGMNVDVRYNYWGGCLVSPLDLPQGEEVWLPLENYHLPCQH
jgi:hypothetical protein